MAVTSVFGNFPILFKEIHKGSFNKIVLTQSLNYQYVMLHIKTISYTATCISAPFLLFQWTMWNIATYRSMHGIAMYIAM